MAKDNAPPSPPPVTRWLADRASGIDFADLPEAAVTVTRHCILDWFAVTLPGAVEPTAQILRDELLEDGALPVASLVGFPGRTSAAHAAIINGTASHALDFDDVNMAVLGHPTVAILPGLLALAEEIDATDEEELSEAVSASTADQLTALITDEGDRRLWRSVSALSSGERTAVVLFYRQGMKVREIAYALGVTDGTVKTLLFRARRHLRQRLDATVEGRVREEPT